MHIDRVQWFTFSPCSVALFQAGTDCHAVPITMYLVRAFTVFTLTVILALSIGTANTATTAAPCGCCTACHAYWRKWRDAYAVQHGEARRWWSRNKREGSVVASTTNNRHQADGNGDANGDANDEEDDGVVHARRMTRPSWWSPFSRKEHGQTRMEVYLITASL